MSGGVPINSTRIDSEGGDFIVLTDYGSEGLSLSGQYDSFDDAMESMGEPGQQVLVRLVRVVMEEKE